jgi:hypothetical protein
VVLEARDGPPVAPVELALDQHVPDHAALAGDGLVREQADAGVLDAVGVAVEAAQELVAAADGEERGAVGDLLAKSVALRREIRRDEGLLAVLPAADVEEVDLAKRDLVAGTDRP